MQNLQEFTQSEDSLSDRERKQRKRIQSKLESIRRNPLYSIVLFHNQYDSYFPVREANKVLRALRRQIASARVTASQVESVCNQYQQIVQKYWNLLSEFYPRLNGLSPSQWSVLNDSLQEKQILANRHITFVFIPSSEEAAQLAMLVKIFGRAKIIYRNDTSRDGLFKLESLNQHESRFAEELDLLNTTVATQFQLTGIKTGRKS